MLTTFSPRFLRGVVLMVVAASPVHAGAIGLSTTIAAYGPAPANTSSAIYTTSPLGGGLYGSINGESVNLADPTSVLLTNPNPMPAGNYAGTLDMTSESTTRGYVSASLLNGQTHMYAITNGSGSTTTQALLNTEIVESVTFHGSGTVTVGFALDGGSTGTHYAQQIMVALGAYNFNWSANSNPVGYGLTASNNWISTIDSGEGLNGFSFTGVMPVADGQTLGFTLTDSTQCGFGSTCDFMNTGKVSLLTGTGVTYTSQSGVFLTQTGSSTPEPATWAMMLTALSAAVVSRRRRTIR